MKAKGIYAHNIDEAASMLIHILQDSSYENVIFFDGWFGVGASATLREVAQRLKSPSAAASWRSKFSRVMHLDYTECRGMRALQRAVAEQLELPRRVMAMLDEHDEEDDFDGLAEDSRGEVVEVSREIFNSLIGGPAILMIFHSESDEYVDLAKCGLPLHAKMMNCKLLWTFRRRSSVSRSEEAKRKSNDRGEAEAMRHLFGNTGVFVYTNSFGQKDSQLWDLVNQEAQEVARSMSVTLADDRMVEECFLYMWALRGKGVTVDWATHASNYWVCDGIIHGDDDRPPSAWEIGDALHRRILLDWNYMGIMDAEFIPRAIAFSTTHLQEHGHEPRQAPTCSYASSSVVPPKATSYFLVAVSKIPAIMFQHSGCSGLRVLHLSRCSFSFTSPPFHCCSNLRFLLLHYCKDDDRKNNNTDMRACTRDHAVQNGVHIQSGSWRPSLCFNKLWVLDLTHTEWCWLLSEEMMDIMIELRELNVKGVEHWSINDLRGRMMLNLVKLQVSDDNGKDNQVSDDDGKDNQATSTNGESSKQLTSVSFQGCAQLKSLLLRGRLFGNLQELDVSGSSVKTLDLSQVPTSRNLRRLILLGCEKLCAILWPTNKKERPQHLEVLSINTTSDASSTNFPGISSSHAHDLQVNEVEESFNKWRIYLRDAKLLRSLFPLQDYFRTRCTRCHVDICSTATVGGRKGSNTDADEQVHAKSYMVDSKYKDVMKMTAMMKTTMAWACDCPQVPLPHSRDDPSCIIKLMAMQGQETSQHFEGVERSTHSLGFICDAATSLHAYDSACITNISAPPVHPLWPNLKWCRVERCPNLVTIFTTVQTTESETIFYNDILRFRALEAFKERAAGFSGANFAPHPESSSFGRLEVLHLENCPRLKHVFSSAAIDTFTLPSLQTLHITSCGDLSEVISLDPHQQLQQTIELLKLRRIHLHDLPKLRSICGHRMSAPSLQMVRVRGCRALTRLPAVNDEIKPPPMVAVDCEKDWWDGLEWDGPEWACHDPSRRIVCYPIRDYRGQRASHDPSRYKLSHSPYYRMKMAMGSILR